MWQDTRCAKPSQHFFHQDTEGDINTQFVLLHLGLSGVCPFAYSHKLYKNKLGIETMASLQSLQQHSLGNCAPFKHSINFDVRATQSVAAVQGIAAQNFQPCFGHRKLTWTNSTWGHVPCFYHGIISSIRPQLRYDQRKAMVHAVQWLIGGPMALQGAQGALAGTKKDRYDTWMCIPVGK